MTFQSPVREKRGDATGTESVNMVDRSDRVPEEILDGVRGKSSHDTNGRRIDVSPGLKDTNHQVSCIGGDAGDDGRQDRETPVQPAAEALHGNTNSRANRYRKPREHPLGHCRKQGPEPAQQEPDSDTPEQASGYRLLGKQTSAICRRLPVPRTARVLLL